MVLSLQDTRVAGKVRRDLGQRRHFPIHVFLFSPAKSWSLSHVLRKTSVVIFYHVCNSRAQMSSASWSASRRLADHDFHHEEETEKGWALHTRNARFRLTCVPIITSWRAVFHTQKHQTTWWSRWSTGKEIVHRDSYGRGGRGPDRRQADAQRLHIEETVSDRVVSLLRSRLPTLTQTAISLESSCVASWLAGLSCLCLSAVHAIYPFAYHFPSSRLDEAIADAM
jgi:hypothetical protein